MPKTRVLIIDDAVAIRRLLSEALASDPELEVAGVAANGRIGFAMISQTNPDVLVLDLEMPEMDGLQALALIRASYPKLPVIVFSAISDPALVEASKAAGADAYWVKAPYSFEDFPARLKQSLSSRPGYGTGSNPADFADLSARRAQAEVMKYGQEASESQSS